MIKQNEVQQKQSQFQRHSNPFYSMCAFNNYFEFNIIWMKAASNAESLYKNEDEIAIYNFSQRVSSLTGP